MRPQLQIALDVGSICEAKRILTKEVLHEVDIVEAGTLLLAAEGARAVKELRKHIGEKKTLVADFKIADGAGVLASMFFDAGADLTTVIAAAGPDSMKKAQEAARERGKELQIELYGRWDLQLAKEWYKLGLHHIIFHHARDGAHRWNAADVEQVRRLQEIGYQVSVTGGLDRESIRLFKEQPAFAFIAGRALYGSKEPAKEARAFKEAMSGI